MLAVAAEKSLYQDLYEVNSDWGYPCLPTGYAAIISAGTFTHGHLGPEPLRHLIRHCKAGGVFCIGVNQQHYQTHMILPCVLGTLVADNVITSPNIHGKRQSMREKLKSIVVIWR